jgi:hypothetical protein
VSPDADGVLAFGVKRGSSLFSGQVVCRSLTAWIPSAFVMPTSPPGWQRTVGTSTTGIGMTTRLALIARKQLNLYEEAKAVRAMLAAG